MKYVNTLRRIVAIDNALLRIDPFNDAYDEIWDKLWDKRKALVKSIKDYARCPDRTSEELRKITYVRRKQVKLACRYFNIDYYCL